MESNHHHQTYIRCSWTFRFVCLALPLLIHLRASSALDYVHDKPSSVVMEPDVASVVFVISTSLALSPVLARAIPIYTDERQQQQEQKISLKLESLMICVVMILANIAICDFALRLVWIPLQYVLWWIVKNKFLTVAAKTILYFIKDFATFRPYYLKAIAVSNSKRGFQFLRLVTALKILHSVVSRLEQYPKTVDSSVSDCSPSVGAPEGLQHAQNSSKPDALNPSSE
uniref:G-protein coupled receptors family 1 profile domain-containing protein n=1 Tax=Anopheles dirus TaxID=7168 RepID=A0A182NEU8_9DIPT